MTQAAQRPGLSWEQIVDGVTTPEGHACVLAALADLQQGDSAAAVETYWRLRDCENYAWLDKLDLTASQLAELGAVVRAGKYGIHSIKLDGNIRTFLVRNQLVARGPHSTH